MNRLSCVLAILPSAPILKYKQYDNLAILLVLEH